MLVVGLTLGSCVLLPQGGQVQVLAAREGGTSDTQVLGHDPLDLPQRVASRWAAGWSSHVAAEEGGQGAHLRVWASHQRLSPQWLSCRALAHV